MNGDIKPYIAKNMIVTKTQTTVEVGYVDVNVYTALGALPISNADVSIYTWNEEEGEKIVTNVITDKSGSAPPIELPVLINQGRTSTGGRTEYHLVVKSPGYHTVIIINVEVYSDITTRFNVNLTPVPRGEQSIDEIINVPIQTKNLRR